MGGEGHREAAGDGAHQAWQLLSDFCNFHRLLPSLDACYRVAGEEGRPGCLRRCETASGRNTDGSPTTWATEELLSVDHQALIFTYRVVDSNIGFGRFIAEMKVFPETTTTAAAAAAEGCRIEWSFVADPLKGRRLARLILFLDGSLKMIARSIESKQKGGNL
ncbi:unnamed protein product [Spirodela intermedia]|uniref:Uncharacterized protein n=1 Tax=Spirodela intermedia TaxID=51605 RepID=A0A7I8JRV8_SPIIN|nr:unnamed protein product [Spirodela intermedia]CAA6672869.1 unnamed protein product [Spirodela intermedia]